MEIIIRCTGTLKLCVGFLAQLDGFDPTTLDPLQRILLVTDGTLTDTLEAAFLEPIGLRKIALDIAPAQTLVDGLDIRIGEPLLDRKIVLYGETTGRPYVYADSFLALDRLPPRFRAELMSSDTPMGRLWSEYKMETWKELLHVARRPAADRAEHLQIADASECVVRRYRLISGGRPLMVIEEQFPVRY
jgi:chorismate-pyruvate lyase